MGTTSCVSISKSPNYVWEHLLTALGLTKGKLTLPEFLTVKKPSPDPLSEHMRLEVQWASTHRTTSAKLFVFNPNEGCLKIGLYSDNDRVTVPWRVYEFMVEPDHNEDNSKLCLKLTHNHSKVGTKWFFRLMDFLWGVSDKKFCDSILDTITFKILDIS